MPMDDDYDARVAAGEAWVLEEAGAVRGVLGLEERADHLLLENVAVEPARRGEGDGRALLDFAEAEARRRGLPEIRLYTNELMGRNIALYAARGYAETERLQEKGFCRVFMAKRVG
jgi:N-acetylglutamate synthase-like GNAT family acetyltransferase